MKKKWNKTEKVRPKLVKMVEIFWQKCVFQKTMILHRIRYNRGSLSAIFNINLDLDSNPMFASMEHTVRVEIKVDIENIPIHMHMLHRSKHRVRVKI